MTYGIRLKVWGDHACFTRAEMKVERVSYDVMTPSAARGILEAVHWKPAIRWVVDAIHVLRCPRFQSIRRNEVGSKVPAGKVKSAMKRGDLEDLQLLVDEDRQQRASTVLVKPAYVIAAHFELTSQAGAEDNEGKHLDLFNRRARRGQCFHQPCLGTREFAAHFELIEADEPMPEPSAEHRTRDLGFGAPRDLGFMLWDIDHQAKGKPSMFFRVILDRGVVIVPPPELAGDPAMSILASLVHAYERLPDAPPLGYSEQNIGAVISLNEDGTVANVTDWRVSEGKKKKPQPVLVPQPVKRTAGIAPNCLWDKTSYVLGVTAGEGRRTAEEHAAFKQRHEEDLAGSDDPGLSALLGFLCRWTPDQFVAPLWSDEMRDQNVIFVLESDRSQKLWLHNRPAAKALWSRLANSAASGAQVCLVTGESCPVARLHPAIKGVWGGQSSGGSIVSFNLDAFTSYGHEQGDNAPVSEAAAFAYTTALNRFLARDSRHRIQIGDASTVFWADASDPKIAERAEDFFWQAFDPAQEEAAASNEIAVLLERLRRGDQSLSELAPELTEGVRFHVLGLAPNAARISIRFYYESDFGVLAGNYRRFVSDMRLEPPPREGYPPLWRYLRETAVLGKTENVPPNLAGEWMRSILAGTDYPLTLLSAVLSRIRADGEINALRVGVLRALLVRNLRMNPSGGDKRKEAPVALDPDNSNKGYLLGRLFAVYEQAQSAALGRNVNSTIKDKFYGSASATPRNVFPALERGSANHLSKVGKERPGQRVNLEKAIGGIMDQMSPGDDPFPASLSAAQQAMFGLGYYHQRGEFFRKRETGTEEIVS